jgi:carotenoid 1,2-hydratase
VRFDARIPAGGYGWWYVDAISDDGAQALTLIAFIGSVFSPYYAWANRKGYARAENFCAMNCVLYRPRGGRWAMTERSEKRLARGADFLSIGPSSLRWDGAVLRAEIDERAAPIPRAVRGRFSLTAGAIQERVFTLDAAGRHRWRPIAPRARVEVRFEDPAVAWSGDAYFDTNDGDVPLAEDFCAWHWSRSRERIFYDVTRVDGSRHVLGLALGDDGVLRDIEAPPAQILPRTFWGVERVARGAARVARTLEDAPFYARSILRDADGVESVHESLSLRRFSAPIVQAMLPFRMPRHDWGRG